MVPGFWDAGRLWYQTVRAASAYLEVPGDVGACQDSRGRREEDGEHAKEATIDASPVGDQVLNKNVPWKTNT